MPYKKNEWGDIPHETYVRDKDVMGRWIVCNICNIKIRCRSQFCFPEWVSHCSGVRHSKIANCEILKKNPRIDTFFKKREATEMTVPVDASDKKKDSNGKRKKCNSCTGFYYGQNTDLLPLYDKYKKRKVSMIPWTLPAGLENGQFTPLSVLGNR